LLAGLSAVLYALLQAAHMPAALLLACMAAGICTSLRDFTNAVSMSMCESQAIFATDESTAIGAVTAPASTPQLAKPRE
jgi:uncharacterized membrane protein AbrB (regulator of aidB expression)